MNVNARACMLLLCLLKAGAGAEDWVVQEDIGSGAGYVYRIEALTGSVKRDGPWATFEQRLIIQRNATNGIREDRTMAVNCVTGAADALKSRTFESGAGSAPTHAVDRNFAEVERAAIMRVTPASIPDSYAGRVFRFACSCAADPWPNASVKFPESDLRAVYEAHIFEQRKTRQFRVAHLRVDAESVALKVIGKLKRGASFESMVAEHSTADHGNPGGDLGFHDEGRWSGRERELLRSLRPGEFSGSPHKGPFGWDVYKLIEIRELPAPSLKDSRPAITAYLQRDLACGASAR